jgi:hypothetical protein
VRRGEHTLYFRFNLQSVLFALYTLYTSKLLTVNESYFNKSSVIGPNVR